jgi:anti-sigma B factor antagonist
MPQLATVEFSTPVSDELVVRLSGEIDMSNAVELRVQIVGHVGVNATVWLDLTAITFCDSAGLSMLDTLAAEIGTERVHLVASIDSPVMRILTITGMTEIFRLHEHLPHR